MTWKTRFALILLLGLVCGPGCGGDCDPQPPPKIRGSADRLQGKLLITGSSTMAPLVAAIAKRFQTFHPKVEIEVNPGGFGHGLTDVLEERSDIGMVSRALPKNSDGLFGFPIARDGICLIVERDNSVTALSNRQIREIYTGRTTNWQKVGGRDRPITVITRPEDRTPFKLFAEYFRLEAAQIKAQLAGGDNPAVLAAMAGQPDAIAILSVGEAIRRSAEGTPIKLLPLDGVAATIRTVRTGEFPLSRSLNLVTKGFPTGVKMAFIEFALSSQIIDIVKDYNFVPYLD